jgi:hypothetical protein
MAWTGNITNTPPNNIQKSNTLSDATVGTNRAFNGRRDKDTVKNVGINLLDIDTTILNHLNNEISPHVITEGNTRVKVPIIYASPERWKSAQADGIIRDFNGKLQLPAIMIKREGFEKNENLMTLNRHLTYPVMTKYSEKNKYDKFSILNDSVTPVHAIHMITLPDHIRLTYKLMIWTELIEQMNLVIEKINFSTEDYWGDKKRYRFRVYVGDYSNNVEVVSGKDRMVRTEFSLTVMAYLLPDSFEDKKLTHQKILSPRKVVVSEHLGTNLDNKVTPDKEVKASLNDGFIQLDEETADLKKNKISFDSNILDTVTLEKIRNVYINIVNASIASNDDIWHVPPTNENDYGKEGWMAYDGNFHYIYTGAKWKRQPITNFTSF